MAKHVGSAKIKLNGMLLGTVPNTVEVMEGGKQRTAQIADGIFHTNETDVPGSIKAEFLHTAAFSFKTVNELTDGLIEVEYDIGTRLEMTGATRIGDPISSTTSDGRVKAEFSGTVVRK
jgi:hypothetical protein